MFSSEPAATSLKLNDGVPPCARALPAAASATGATASAMAEAARAPRTTSRRDSRAAMTSPMVGLPVGLEPTSSLASNRAERDRRSGSLMAVSPWQVRAARAAAPAFTGATYRRCDSWIAAREPRGCDASIEPPPLAGRADAVDGDHRLRAAVDAELLQDGGDVRLDGGLRHAELEGDLLVEQPLAQHHEHAHLLRRQRGETRHQLGALARRLAGKVDVGRQPHLAADDAADRLADALHRLRLRDEPRGPAIEALADGAGVVARRDDHHRHLRVLGAQVDEPRHAVHPRHAEIKQDEVDLAGGAQLLGQLVEGAGLQNLGIGERGAQRLPQCAAKQRMVVNDDEPVIRHWLPASPLRRDLPPYLRSASRPSGNLAAFQPIG